MAKFFLIGGGWRLDTFSHTYGRFLEAATCNKQRRIAIITAEEPDADPKQHFFRFRSVFERIGTTGEEIFSIIVSAKSPLGIEILNEKQPTGIFVCGGLTPAYYDGLCVETSWLNYLFENDIPYCGFSAGASIAAELAVIGGWRRKINDKIIEITNENAGEDLDLLDVRRGLGLVPFAVDVHAAQWGTLSRLIHTINANLASEGWAIDENTMLEVNGNRKSVYGAGSAYCVYRRNEQISVDIFQSD